MLAHTQLHFRSRRRQSLRTSFRLRLHRHSRSGPAAALTWRLCLIHPETLLHSLHRTGSRAKVKVKLRFTHQFRMHRCNTLAVVIHMSYRPLLTNTTITNIISPMEAISSAAASECGCLL